MQEDVPGAAVEGVGCDDVVACTDEVRECEDLCCVAGSDSHSAGAALDGSDTGCDGVGRRVREAAVDIAGLGKSELCCAVSCVVELECGRCVDRECCRAGHGIGCPACVYLKGVEVLLGVLCERGVEFECHGLVPFLVAPERVSFSSAIHLRPVPYAFV